ncbi:hypothetical protein HRR99_03300 [Agrobacterium vaccinii]|uniref:hypothetical protein n=1 Tax=Agrobacterium vaccinii TaxID=2735528 RepID=UPI001E44F942|nr:hypothetical protein [Agrobacterium vaccinii]UHS60612.1 hypothetical protein HRR99_03300 [Agrobacterium vaccinii]
MYSTSMSAKKPLSDNDVHDRLHDAIKALGHDTCLTPLGTATMAAALTTLVNLQGCLLIASERGDRNNGAIIDRNGL